MPPLDKKNDEVYSLDSLSPCPTLTEPAEAVVGGTTAEEPAVELAVAKEQIQLEIDDAEKGSQPDQGLDVYDRFPKSKKRLILAIVSYAAFLGRECMTLNHLSPRMEH